MSEFALEITNLSFKYTGQSKNCFENLNLQVPINDKFGLFGPNGAGKSSLMHLMTGLNKFEEGSIKLFGTEMKNKPKSLNSLFGFVPQDFSFYQELSPKENLHFFGAWAGLNAKEIKSRTIELLEVLGLSDVINKPVSQFSGGMKRRVNLAIGVIHQPKILFLDEPTVGVDVQSRQSIIEYLRNLNKEGTTLIYTSHQLAEAETLCNNVALIDNGEIIATDSLPELLKTHQKENLEALFIHLTGKSFRD